MSLLQTGKKGANDMLCRKMAVPWHEHHLRLQLHDTMLSMFYAIAVMSDSL